MIAADKTFSPQYLIWLAGPLGLTLAGAKSRSEHLVAGVAAGLGLLIAGLTQWIFPVLYAGLIANPLGDPRATCVLVIRNTLMVVLTALLMGRALQMAWQMARAAR